MDQSSLSLLILFCSIFLQIYTTLCSDAAGDYFRFSCINDGNFTINSTYKTNLDLVFSQISTASDFNDGFYNFSVGQSPDQVNAIGLCRGDQEKEDCRRCLHETVAELQQNCSNFKEAVGWWELCSLRYSSQGIYGVMSSSPFTIHTDIRNVSNELRFNEVMDLLLNRLSSIAAAGGPVLKYATDNVSDPVLAERIYGLAQCTPDLSEQDCSECLARAIQRINPKCYGTRGCRVLQPSCNVRYEVRPFFVAVDGVLQLSPQMQPEPESQPEPEAQPPPPAPPSSTQSPSRREVIGSNETRTIIIAVIASFVSITVFALIWICSKVFKNPKRYVENLTIIQPAKSEVIDECVRYDFATIKEATKDFCDENKLGEGGFGVVYKGELASIGLVAVKRLKRLSSDSNDKEEEIKNEVRLLTKLQHRNLVKILGFCLEGEERILIYEFIINTRLDNYIFDQTKRLQLDWERRYRIIQGIARGLRYLHEEAPDPVIHLDLKAANILLDQDMNPKIADFGMARLFPKDKTHGIVSKIAGTRGYMAPEYALYKQFSGKSDVFSLGVLILEIVSGKKNTFLQNSKTLGFGDLIIHAWEQWKEGTGSRLIDSILGSNGSSTTDEIMKCIHIGLLCVQHVDERPTMASVVGMLSSNPSDLPAPSEPTFRKQRQRIIASEYYTAR